MKCPSTLSPSKLRKTCDYLLIPFNDRTVGCHNLCEFINELSNDGARDQFDCFLESILLKTMITCARKGMRECHIGGYNNYLIHTYFLDSIFSF